MNWPWVSRLAYELVLRECERLQVELGTTVAKLAYDTALDERDRLREKNDELTGHLTRMDRIDRGLGENPKPPRAPIEPMPKDLLEYCNSYASRSLAKNMRDVAYRRHARGESWQDIMLDVMREEEAEKK